MLAGHVRGRRQGRRRQRGTIAPHSQLELARADAAVRHAARHASNRSHRGGAVPRGERLLSAPPGRAACARACGAPTSWTASGRPCFENPAGTDAAGWPVEFQSTPNGTQPLSHCHVANAPRPSITCAGARGPGHDRHQQHVELVPQTADARGDPLLGGEQTLDDRVRDERAGPGHLARAALEPLRALDVEHDVADPAEQQRDDARHVARAQVRVALDHLVAEVAQQRRRCRAARRGPRRESRPKVSRRKGLRVGDPQRPRLLATDARRHHLEHQRRVGRPSASGRRSRSSARRRCRAACAARGRCAA